MLVVRRKQNQDLIIGDDIIITVGGIERNCVKLCILTPKGVRTVRGEVYRFGLNWSFGEAARLLDVAPCNVYRWAQKGVAGVKLPHFLEGDKKRKVRKVRERDIYEFLCWLESSGGKGPASKRVIKCEYFDRLKAKYER